jgi:hypothetical protein
VTAKAPAKVTEGDRYAVTVHIGASRTAKKVTLDQQVKNIYGTLEWTPVRAVRAAGKKAVTFKRVAGETNSEKYRARVTYTGGRTLASKPVNVRVWHWYPLSSFRAYYSTGGSSNESFLTFAMNGDSWKGWYTYGGPAWDDRFTPGRNCTRFRGSAGVQDRSSDGSSATITLIADETEIVWQSPTLTPGMVAAFDVPLAQPYRFAIQAHDTSTEPAKAGPAIGAPEFLCRID